MLISNRLFLPLLILIFSFAVQAVSADETRATRVLLETSKGNIELELYPDMAPSTAPFFTGSLTVS